MPMLSIPSQSRGGGNPSKFKGLARRYFLDFIRIDHVEGVYEDESLALWVFSLGAMRMYCL